MFYKGKTNDFFLKLEKRAEIRSSKCCYRNMMNAIVYRINNVFEKSHSMVWYGMVWYRMVFLFIDNSCKPSIFIQNIEHIIVLFNVIVVFYCMTRLT